MNHSEDNYTFSDRELLFMILVDIEVLGCVNLFFLDFVRGVC